VLSPVRPRALAWVTLSSLTLSSLVGCSAPYEAALHRDLRRAEHQLTPRADDEAPTSDFDGSLEAYVRYASAESPTLRASLERWRSAIHRIAPARTLPEPTITYGFYFGPDMHQIMLQQDLPWPTRLTRAADAQSARALAAQRRFEAQALELRMRVASAYWRLWSIRARREVDREQVALLDTLAEAVRARLSIGQATLADLAPIELGRARLDDALQGLDEDERAAEAALRAALGAPRGAPVPTAPTVPPPALPHEPPEALAAAVATHPYLASFALLAEASEADAAAIGGDRLPRLRFGVEGRFDMQEAQIPMEGVVASVGVSIPLWQDAYEDRQRAARAEGEAQRADAEAALDAAEAELEATLATLRDSHRRVRLYETTLVPQAQTAYESVVGRLVAGQGELGAALSSQRDLLELRAMAIAARAQHGEAWARLERVVGRPVRIEEARHE
jgi:cobalt-zinc-cadmium efflux system outer membrane protein